MKFSSLVIGTLLAFSASHATACPQMKGSYQFENEMVRIILSFDQTECSKIILDSNTYFKSSNDLEMSSDIYSVDGAKRPALVRNRLPSINYFESSQFTTNGLDHTTYMETELNGSTDSTKRVERYSLTESGDLLYVRTFEENNRVTKEAEEIFKRR